MHFFSINIPIQCLLFTLALLAGCDFKQNGKDEISSKDRKSSDKVIISQEIPNEELAGGNYRNRATGYRMIEGTDTSSFQAIFHDNRNDGGIYLNLNNGLTHTSESFRNIIEELQLILAAANNDYNLDSLHSIYLGRIIRTKELVIEISRQYHEQFGDDYDMPTSRYEELTNFLENSALTTSFNTILKPYGLRVDKVLIEKAFFIPREDYLLNYPNADSTSLPPQIIDFMTTVQLKTY